MNKKGRYQGHFTSFKKNNGSGFGNIVRNPRAFKSKVKRKTMPVDTATFYPERHSSANTATEIGKVQE